MPSSSLHHGHRSALSAPGKGPLLRHSWPGSNGRCKADGSFRLTAGKAAQSFPDKIGHCFDIKRLVEPGFHGRDFHSGRKPEPLVQSLKILQTGSCGRHRILRKKREKHQPGNPILQDPVYRLIDGRFPAAHPHIDAGILAPGAQARRSARRLEIP